MSSQLYIPLNYATAFTELIPSISYIVLPVKTSNGLKFKPQYQIEFYSKHYGEVVKLDLYPRLFIDGNDQYLEGFDFHGFHTTCKEVAEFLKMSSEDIKIF